MPPRPLTEETLQCLPVFPLPATVLFPGTAMPLHIFEPRYLAMVREAVRGNGAMAIAMLEEGADPMEPQASIHRVACAGRIVHAEEIEDDRVNILVHGLDRVELVDELPLREGYRRFMTRRLATEDAGNAAQEIGRLHSCVVGLRSAIGNQDEQLVEVLQTTSDPVQLTDILAAVLITDANLRQSLLATDDLRHRIQVLIDAMAEVIVRVGEKPATGKLN